MENTMSKSRFSWIFPLSAIIIMSLLAVGCNKTFRTTLVPDLFDGLNMLADDVACGSCEALNTMIDGLLNATERVIYPEG